MTQVTIKEVSSEQLAQMLKENAEDIFLLDIREPTEVEICALPQCVHIPMNLIPIYLNQIPDDKVIVIYCHHGVRSLNVAYYLLDNGFDLAQLYSLKGGIDEWALSIDKTMNRY